MTLKEFFNENKRAALGFSGGVDSSYLLYEAVKNGCDIQPYFIKTAFQPQFELDDAVSLCDRLGVSLKVIELDVLNFPDVLKNDADRCYHCKKALFGTLRERAAADGYSLLLDGSNASDDAGDRPGMRATAELEIRSPLRECGLTKTEIRSRLRDYGLSVWDKPSYSCLATRVRQNSRIELQILDKIEKSEGFLFSLGFSGFRVRVNGSAAKIELPAGQFEKFISRREEILNALTQHFDEVTLNLKERDNE